MTGHIRLGATAATLQEYMLNDVRSRRRQLANPMAPRLATGGEFNDYENWSLHAVADWREGVGKRAEDAAGFLYGELESRVPEQLILPAALGCSEMRHASTDVGEVCRYMPATTDSFVVISLGGTGNPLRHSIPIYVYSGTEANFRGLLDGIAVLGYIPDGVSVTAALYSDSAGAPSSPVASGTLVASTQRPGYQWYWIPLSSMYQVTAASGADLHWVIYPTDGADSIELAGGAIADYLGSGDGYTWSGSAWSTTTNIPFFLYSRPSLVQGVTTVRHSGARGFTLESATGNLLCYAGQTTVSTGAYNSSRIAFQYNPATDVWERDAIGGASVATLPDDVNDGAMFDGVYYIPLTTSYTTWNVAGASMGSSTDDAHLFCAWSGYLWRAYNNQLWYSSDGSIWTEVTGGIGGSDYRVRGLAGLGVNMYVCTDEALYSVFPGDVVAGIFPWGTISADNGRGMMVHQGALYIPAQGRLWKYTEDGTLTDIWINRDEDLNARRLGRIASLASLNNMLVAGVDGTTSSDPSSVWAYTGLGWHHLATLPPNFQIRSLYYDRVRSRLWISTDDWAVFYIYAPDWALNPYNDSNSLYMPHGWMETDRLYLGTRDLFKDVESMRVYGDFETGADVAVYWRDQDSTDWELLGTIDADGEELRWSTVATRPATRWIRIGLLFRTDDPTLTTRVRAWVLKSMPMIRDRWRWDMTVAIGDNQQMIGGQMDDRTAEEKRDAIESLIESVAPILFEDVDGRQYWVKIMHAQERLDQYENNGYDSPSWAMQFTLALEQIQSVFS